MRALFLVFLIFVIIDICIGPKTSSFKWTPELDREIMRIHKAISLKDHYNENKMKEMWDRELPEHRNVKKKVLRERLRNLIKALNGDGIRKDRKRYPWSEELKNELIHIQYTIPRGNRTWSTRIYEEWIKKHPEFKGVPPLYLIKVAGLHNKKRNIYPQGDKDTGFKWQRQHDAEILHIYHHTQPNMVNHSSRMHEHWARIHPDLAYMNRNNLRRRVWSLIKKNTEFTDEEKERARINFEKSVQAAQESKDKEVSAAGDSITPFTEPENHKILQQRLDDPIYSPLHYQDLLYDCDDLYHHHLLDFLVLDHCGDGNQVL